jgi:hypothetical protein
MEPEVFSNEVNCNAFLEFHQAYAVSLPWLFSPRYPTAMLSNPGAERRCRIWQCQAEFQVWCRLRFRVPCSKLLVTKVRGISSSYPIEGGISGRKKGSRTLSTSSMPKDGIQSRSQVLASMRLITWIKWTTQENSGVTWTVKQ